MRVEQTVHTSLTLRTKPWSKVWAKAIVTQAVENNN